MTALDPVMTALDHIVFNTQDRTDEVVALFERLGFTVSPRGFHTLGSVNHTIVFGTDYLELLGYPPGQPPAKRPELVIQPLGLMATVLQTADADAAHAVLTQRGVKPRAVQTFSRPVNLGAGPIGEASLGDASLRDASLRDASFRVTRLEPDAVPGTWVYYCQHLTPDLVWHPPWQSHANGALSMRAIDIAVPDVAAALPRYRACIFDDAVEDDISETVGAGGSSAILPLRNSVIRLHQQDGPARMTGITFEIASLHVAQKILRRANIAHEMAGLSIRIDPAATFGATLQLTALAR